MVSVVQQLLAAGADVNAADNTGATALHVAVNLHVPARAIMEQAAAAKLSVVQQLLAAGADVHATTNLGSTALHVAACHKVSWYLLV
jgi:ankyrin repeat protein